MRARGIGREEYVILTVVLNDREDIVYSLIEDGEIEFPPCQFVRVRYAGKNKAFSAIIFHGA